MNSTAAAQLLFFQVLADRKGNPAGLLIDTGSNESAELLELIEGEEFSELKGKIACMVGADVAPAVSEALQQAGWKTLPAASVMRVDGQLSNDLGPGVQWLTGNWCMAPPAKPVGPQAASRTVALQLVQLVSADADTHEIEALLRQDPTLSYHLLRLVNSLAMGVGRKITSFSQAILILGRTQLRRWLNLMLFSARQGDVRSAMLLARVAVRARTIELLAKQYGLDRNAQEQGFMTGMFSLLGTLFGMPLPEVIAPLMISDAVQAALLTRSGELGVLLKACEAGEQGDRDGLAGLLAMLPIAPEDFNRVLVEAYGWMLGVLRESRGGGDA